MDLRQARRKRESVEFPGGNLDVTALPAVFGKGRIWLLSPPSNRGLVVRNLLNYSWALLQNPILFILFISFVERFGGADACTTFAVRPEGAPGLAGHLRDRSGRLPGGIFTVHGRTTRRVDISTGSRYFNQVPSIGTFDFARARNCIGAQDVLLEAPWTAFTAHTSSSPGKKPCPTGARHGGSRPPATRKPPCTHLPGSSVSCSNQRILLIEVVRTSTARDESDQEQ